MTIEEAKRRSEDCISKEGLINELKLGYFNKELQEGKNDPCVIDAMVDWAIRAVKRQPSVTPSRPKGKWIEVDIHNCHATLKCSVCDRIIEPTFTFGEYSYEDIKRYYPYCHCGTDMRGDEE